MFLKILNLTADKKCLKFNLKCYGHFVSFSFIVRIASRIIFYLSIYNITSNH